MEVKTIFFDAAEITAIRIRSPLEWAVKSGGVPELIVLLAEGVELRLCCRHG